MFLESIAFIVDVYMSRYARIYGQFDVWKLVVCEFILASMKCV